MDPTQLERDALEGKDGRKNALLKVVAGIHLEENISSFTNSKFN